MKLELFWGEQPSHWPMGQWLGIFLHRCDCRGVIAEPRAAVKISGGPTPLHFNSRRKPGGFHR